jgi:hypothetical protein
MWNSHEWTAFAAAQPGAQRPLLMQALRDLRAGNAQTESPETGARRYLNFCRSRVANMLTQGPPAYSGFRACLEFAHFLHEALLPDVQRYAATITREPLQGRLQELATLASAVYDRRRELGRDGKYYQRDYAETDLVSIRDAIVSAIDALPPALVPVGPNEDAPVPFDVTQLPDHLELLASSTAGNTVQFASYLATRIRMMLADHRFAPIVAPEQALAFADWLAAYVGDNDAAGGPLTILDLSLVPSDVVHTMVAVLARIIFEATQRYRQKHQVELPTLLVLDEAHVFIQRGAREEPGIPSAAQMCRQTFERLAREGRKFGLGLVLASQRPYELSPTVLAQCNTFLLHRLVNDLDQELVRRLVPDNLSGLLRELPSLPSRQGILLGSAVSIPTLVTVRELPEAYRPRSGDPHFWDVWTGATPRPLDWPDIVEDWTR